MKTPLLNAVLLGGPVWRCRPPRSPARTFCCIFATATMPLSVLPAPPTSPGTLEMSAGYQNYWHAESPKTYCAPDTLDSDTVEKLWREELAVMPAEVKVDAALILYLAVMDKFPCPDQVPQ